MTWSTLPEADQSSVMLITLFVHRLLFTAFLSVDGAIDMQDHRARVLAPQPGELLNIASLTLFLTMAISIFI